MAGFWYYQVRWFALFLAMSSVAHAQAIQFSGAPPQAVNLQTFPESLDQLTATGATVARNVDNDPDSGAAIVDRMIETANTSQHSFNDPNVNFVSGQTYTFWRDVKYENSPYIQLLFGSGAFGSNAWANFDIQNGVLGTVGSATTASITARANGYYRISITATATSTAAAPSATFGANSSSMTRAASYAGSTSNTRLLGKSQVQQYPIATSYARPIRTFAGNTDNAIVGALRWDAWHHPTQDTIRTAIETSLGPSQYHWRLPFFASEPTAESAVISGDQASMDAEIAYAVDAGLDYWAFFRYGISSTNGMDGAFNLFQASASKNNINWCIYFAGQAPLHDDVVNNLAGITAYMQQSNYQKTASGRPLIFVFDDSSSKANLAADLTAIRNAATGAGLQNPYIIFHQSTPSAAVLATYGFNAMTTYAPVAGVSGARPYNQLDTSVRASWDTQAAEGVDVVPSYQMGWDRRPRVENPVPWETPSGSLSDYYYLEYPVDVSTHLDATLAWARANPARTPQKIIIGYAWNENDEGGWITPTKRPGGGTDDDRLKAIKAVLNP